MSLKKTPHPAIFGVSLFLAGCAAISDRKQSASGIGACPPCPQVCVATAPAAAIIPVGTDKIPFFLDQDDKKSLLKAADSNLEYFRSGKAGVIPYVFGLRRITAGTLAASTSEFVKILSSDPDQAELDRRIRENFDIYRLAGLDSTGTVVFSSYYEPALSASLTKTGEYRYPIYAKPDDLVTVNLEDFNEKFKGEKLTGRLNKDALVPYMSREEIDYDEALKGKDLELAWLRDRADLMDLHIEGSGRLQLEDGRQMRAAFAATNSLKFKGWLTALAETGALPREGLTHEKGRQYLLEHPEKARAVMSRNKRYTFFKLEQPADPEEGPTGTYGLPLTGRRSVAVDNALIPLGALAFMSVNAPEVDEAGNLLGRKQDSRFVFCQDTGGAIKGPGRVDFFAGHGPKARTFAFKLWDQGALYLLVLKESQKVPSVKGER